MLNLLFSNRYRTLAEALIDRLEAGRGGPLAPIQVVVPSAAVRRSLTLAIAERDGVCANVRFEFLARWLWRQIGSLMPALEGQAPITADALTWPLFAALGERSLVADEPRLGRYLAGADDVMRYELATRLAGLFEQYATYRPRWLPAWQAGRLALPESAAAQSRADERWQASLWRHVAAATRGVLRDPSIDVVGTLSRAGAAKTLPAAVHVFAVPAMSPAHLEWLRALASSIEVHLYVLNPCREYWFDIVDAKRLAALKARSAAVGHEIGNRLLAAWGQQTQSHLGLLVGAVDDESAAAIERFEPRPGSTLLASLQNAVLDLRELEPGSHLLAADDRSIEVHVCHSRTRELEVLHDRLLGLFAVEPGLRPADILVATPDLDRAGPLIDAVFGTAPSGRFIPYAVTGRSRSQVNAPAQALLAVLALAGSRFASSAVFGLLQQSIVARAYGLDADDLADVHDWMRQAGHRWALDAGHRASFDVPAESRHTLADALGRLFLGYALPARAGEPFDDLLPAGDAEGSGAVLLGALWRFVEDVRALAAAVAVPLAPLAWSKLLLDAIDTFTRPSGDEAEDAHELRLAVRALCADAAAAGDEAIPLGVVRAALQRALDDPSRGGVAGGGVTFSSMAGLRSLPFAVVCVIGLDDGAFPTPGRSSELDLMAAAPRPGDRQRRRDERTLFLDLLLAAEQTLHLSYCGRSQRDNALLSPSVLIAELLDVLLPAVAIDARSAGSLASARGRLVVEHPLQPFAPAAFSPASDVRLRSHDAELAAALRQRDEVVDAVHIASSAGSDGAAGAGEADDPDDADELIVDAAAPPFFTAPLPAPGPEWRVVALPQLLEFFNNPSRYLLLHRLGIGFPRGARELGDDEPFLADTLMRFALADRLLPRLLEGPLTAPTLRRLAEAGTELPGGALGAQHLRSELATLQRFAARVREATAAPPLPPHTASVGLDLDGEAWRIDAAYADLRPLGLVRWHFDEIRARDALTAWLAHLVLAADPPPAMQLRTDWLGIDDALSFGAVAEPHALLADLLRLYRDGLSSPLRFFPKSAWACWRSGQERRFEAGTKWRVTRDMPFAEGSDAAYRVALRGAGEAIDDTFFRLARAVCEPLVRHRLPAGSTP